ncbi:MAG: sulfite exporter TauE/SafE family protein [Synergistaceae bacterium]|jgi:uncharacterized membrane protein YfcA|nr:sulfite exporter TauE/SafE family protein [Synergistaceae bacterium]
MHFFNSLFDLLFNFLSLGQWNLTLPDWGIFCLAVFIVGFAKAGLPGATIIAVPLMAMILPPKISVGVMLPIYMIADIMSVWHWRRYAERNYCFPYLLFVGLGIWGASFIVRAVDNKTFGLLIGWAILILLLISLLTEAWGKRTQGKNASDAPPPEKPSLAISAFFGFSTGLISSLANAAGPIVSLYMIVSRRNKFQFLGTVAVCAFFMNWAKIPLFVSLGSISLQTLKLDVAAIPAIALGVLAGFILAGKIPQKAFKNVICLLTFLASLNLIFR